MLAWLRCRCTFSDLNVLEPSLVYVDDTPTVLNNTVAKVEGYFGMACVLWSVNIDATPSARNNHSHMPELSITVQKHQGQMFQESLDLA